MDILVVIRRDKGEEMSFMASNCNVSSGVNSIFRYFAYKHCTDFVPGRSCSKADSR